MPGSLRLEDECRTLLVRTTPEGAMVEGDGPQQQLANSLCTTEQGAAWVQLGCKGCLCCGLFSWNLVVSHSPGTTAADTPTRHPCGGGGILSCCCLSVLFVGGSRQTQ